MKLLLLNREFRIEHKIKKNINSAVLLGLILIMGTALRLYNLGTENYWIDEMYTVIESQQTISQMITAGRLDQPPAYYLPLHFWVQVFGYAEVSTRLFSALAGIGSIVLAYLVGQELFGKSAGLISAFLMAISEFQIYYSQLARFYAFFEFATLLSFLLFIQALRKKRKIDFVIYVAATILMVYSHAFGVFILVAQALYFILRWKKYIDVIPIWLISQLMIVLAIAPFFYPFIFGGNSVKGEAALNIGNIPAPALREPLHTIYHFMFPARGTYGDEITYVSYTVAIVLLVIGTCAYVIREGKSTWVMAVKGWFSSLRAMSDLTGKLILLGCWLLCPIVLPFVFTLVVFPIYKEHYTISAAPALYLLVALGIFNTRKVVPIILSLVITFSIIIPSLTQYYVKDTNEQWAEVAAYIEENSKSDDVIVFAPDEYIGIEHITFNWYSRGNLQECGLGLDLTDSEVRKALEQCISNHDQYWVIIRGASTDPHRNRYSLFFLNPNQGIMRLISEQHFVDISVYLFELAK
jgi:mannosyltransferase